MKNFPYAVDEQHSAVNDSVYCFDSINSNSGTEPKQLRKTEIYAKKKMPLIESLCSQKEWCVCVHVCSSPNDPSLIY